MVEIYLVCVCVCVVSEQTCTMPGVWGATQMNKTLLVLRELLAFLCKI